MYPLDDFYALARSRGVRKMVARQPYILSPIKPAIIYLTLLVFRDT